jgi:hypothetical protein
MFFIFPHLPYCRLLRLEDKVRGHKFYRRTAHSAMDMYLSMHDAPHKVGANGVSEGGSEATGMAVGNATAMYSRGLFCFIMSCALLARSFANSTRACFRAAGMSEKELKKLLSKQRREQARKAATKEEPKAKGMLARRTNGVIKAFRSCTCQTMYSLFLLYSR